MNVASQEYNKNLPLPLSMISNLPGMVCRFKNDLDWTMEFMSEGCQELTGYTPGELISNRTTSYGKITLEEDNLRVWQTIQAAIWYEKKYQVEYRIITREGDLKWLWEQGAAIYDDEGQVVAIEAFMTDITRQKNTEIELHNTIRELNDRNLELDTFTYKVSHDIRSPLLTIYGLTDVLKNEKSLELIPEYCARIDSTVHKLDLFTKDLLIYARSKEHSESRQKIDFNVLISDALNDSGYPNYSDFIRLKTTICIEREVVSESFRLKVILSNLFSNAIKYRDTLKPVSYLNVEVLSKAESFMITIEDNGIGIDRVYQEEVFKMFFRATEISEGTGLGLYIVKMNIDKLMGSISCISKKDSGSVFTLNFPHIN